MSKIEWTNKTWNPTTGCNKVSQGCKNCYALTMHKRLQGMGQQKYQQDFLKGVVMHDSELRYPLTVRKPTMFFVNSMSDLFHEDVTFDFIDNVFAVMDCKPQHTFQILTKRPDRMYEYFKENRGWRVGQLKVSYDSKDYDLNSWPLKNVIIGTSCEDAETFNKRSVYIAYLAQLGWRTMLSLEPLLGPINLFMDGIYENAFGWVITGGESGHGARPMHPDWIRSLRDQCAKSNTPFFFKQWGAYSYIEKLPFKVDLISKVSHYWDHEFVKINKKDPAELLNKFPLACSVGKSKSGHLLDGKEHHEFPII